jgi:geranylgeranyl pyrophosphate synthase
MLAMADVELTYGLKITQSLLVHLNARLLNLVGFSTDAINAESQSEASLAATYHLGSGGRLIRARMALHASLALGMSESDALSLAAVAELLHNASLVQDDLQDGDKLRRGLPAVWTKFNSNIAICTGDLMLSAAYAALSGVSNPYTVHKLLALVHELTAVAISGQCADLGTRCLPVNDIGSYKTIAIGKSGALLSLPLELALTASGHDDWAHEARLGAEAFSVAYQVADDLSDIQGDASRNSLNIMAVIEASAGPDDVLKRACRFGTEHLDKALTVAQNLPCGSGAVLLQLSHELHDFFNHRMSG